MVPDMDLNSSFASRIVREELTETKEGGSLTQRRDSTSPNECALPSAASQTGSLRPVSLRLPRRAKSKDLTRQDSSLNPTQHDVACLRVLEHGGGQREGQRQGAYLTTHLSSLKQTGAVNNITKLSG